MGQNVRGKDFTNCKSEEKLWKTLADFAQCASFISTICCQARSRSWSKSRTRIVSKEQLFYFLMGPQNPQQRNPLQRCPPPRILTLSL